MSTQKLNVTCVGAGTLGGQVAWMSAITGHRTVVWARREEGLTVCKKAHQDIAARFVTEGRCTLEQVSTALNTNLSYTTDLAEALKDADIVSESISEGLEIKQAFYPKMHELAPARTVFTSNTSSLMPSAFAESTGRPEQFCALHFANMIWDINAAEVMGHPGTSQETLDKVEAFAEALHMISLPVLKENPGYLFNSMVFPLLAQALNLLHDGVSDMKSLDRAWMLTYGMRQSAGPFAIMDQIGIQTVANIFKGLSEVRGEPYVTAYKCAQSYVDAGKLGVSSGEGFYTYPDPAFLEPDFLGQPFSLPKDQVL